MVRLRLRGDIKTADIVDASKEFRNSLSGRLPAVAAGLFNMALKT